MNITELKKLLDQPASNLPFKPNFNTTRIMNVFANAHIETIGQLVEWKQEKLLKQRNFGKYSLLIIIEALNEFGLDFGINLSVGNRMTDRSKCVQCDAMTNWTVNVYGEYICWCGCQI